MAKDKSITELRDERNQLLVRAQDIVAAAKADNNRKLTEVEQNEVTRCQLDAKELELQIEQRKNILGAQRNSGKPTEKFSLRRALLAHLSGKDQRDVEAQAIEDAQTYQRNNVSPSSISSNDLVLPMFESRGLYSAVSEAVTGVVVEEDKQELLLPLRSNLTLAKAGARFMTGLTGNIVWPKHSDVQVYWEGENTPAQDGKGAFSKGAVFAPRRLAAYVDISEQLLIQESFSVEAYLRQLFAEKIAEKIEATAFSAAAHTENVPDGLFQNLGNISGDMNWANIVAMETEIDVANALKGNLAYIMHPTLVGKAKTKVKDSSGAGGFIFTENGDGQLNGYKALRTNNIPKNLGDAGEYGIVFGNWGDFFVGQWGSMVIKTDPFSGMKNGMISLVVNSYWNMGAIRSESFCVASMK